MGRILTEAGGTIYVRPRGGLGNILFTYLSGFSLANEYGMRLKVISNYRDRRGNIQQYKFFEHCAFEAITEDVIENSSLISQSGFHYQPIVIDDVERDYILDGYFQSYKYFERYLSLAKAQLFDPVACDSIRTTVSPENSIALHVRRGDYLFLPQHHPVLPEDYYRKALDIVYREGMRILAFSDDIHFLRRWGLLKEYPSEIIDLPAEESFMLMTMSDHFIVANSSFSLLAYYFRDHPDATLCIPGNWFGPLGPACRLEDFICCPSNTYQL